MSHDNEGRDWSDTSVSRGTPEIASGSRRQEKGRHRTLPKSLQGECGPGHTLVLDFSLQNCENRFLLFKAIQLVEHAMQFITVNGDYYNFDKKLIFKK